MINFERPKSRCWSKSTLENYPFLFLNFLNRSLDLEYITLPVPKEDKNIWKNTYNRFPISIHLQGLRLVTLDFPLDRPCTCQHLWWLGHNSRCLESRCHQDLSMRKLTMNDIFMQIFFWPGRHTRPQCGNSWISLPLILIDLETQICKVWKFHDFCITQIFREINYVETGSANSAV